MVIIEEEDSVDSFISKQAKNDQYSKLYEKLDALERQLYISNLKASAQSLLKSSKNNSDPKSGPKKQSNEESKKKSSSNEYNKISSNSESFQSCKKFDSLNRFNPRLSFLKQDLIQDDEYYSLKKKNFRLIRSERFKSMDNYQ